MKNRIFIGTAGVVLLLLTSVSCRPPEGQPTGHAHAADGSHVGHGHGAEAEPEEESVTFAVTVWTNGFEVFMEHEAFVAGEAGTFVTHVSRLVSGDPKRTGAVRFLARSSTGAEFEHLQGRPARDGIYLPRIKFPSAGEWDIRIRIVEAGSATVIPLGMITVHTGHEAAEAAQSVAVAGIPFLKEQQWQYPTLMRLATTRTLIERFTVPAEVAAKSGNRGAITTPIAGRLIATTNGFPEIGQPVRAGQIIAYVQPVFSEITTRLVAARAAVDASRIKLADADKTHARIRVLAREGAKSQRDLQQAQREMQLAESDHAAALALQRAYAAANSNLLSGRAEDAPSIALTAPIGGSVVRLAPIAMGEFIAEGTTIAWTLNSNPVHLHAHVPESFAARLTSITGADVERSDGTTDRVFDKQRGRLVSIGSQIHPDTQTATVIIETPNTDPPFRVGQQTTLYLHTGRATNALALPSSALIEEQGMVTVYVQIAGETFAKRIVQTGIRDGDWVQILSGVTTGEMVAVKNAYAIRLAAVAGGAIPHSNH
jgi:cobalt-zinc-cadmium efflux system membrane fusion protein